MVGLKPSVPTPRPATPQGEVVYRNATLEFAAKIAAEPNTSDKEMSQLGDMIRRDADEILKALLARRQRS